MSRRSPEPAKTVNCAIYTRKSTDENLDNDFNTLDSQRQYCEAYIKSQESMGWVCLKDRYDDGGFSGGTLNRPAFKRLMADVESGRVTCIVCYKLERLSRSLLDFLNLMKLLEAKGVSFCSVTQQFNTATSAGRMSLNMMLTLAQYERENASERTRDKIAAARQRGKWSGGRPLLGYDIDRETKRLVMNTGEAEQVRHIFNLYMEHEALLAVVTELARLGWVNKAWTTAKGLAWGGRPFDKASLHALLTNVAYVGRVRHHAETYPGEHEAIVSERVFNKVQTILQRNGKSGGADVRNKHWALLKGLLRCGGCHCSMGHSYSSKGGRLRYRYYLCLNASKRGWNACPSPSVPAAEIEAFVLNQIRQVVSEPTMIAETTRQTQREVAAGIKLLETERTTRKRELNRRHDPDIENRLAIIDTELADLRTTIISQAEVIAAFQRFDELWDTLAPHEQTRVARSLIQQVVYDGAAGKVRITFKPTGLRALAQHTNQEAA